MDIVTAILVDGAFFIKRSMRIYGAQPPSNLAKILHGSCIGHLSQKSHAGERKAHLYRIFFYDCPPLDKKVHNPLTGRAIDFSKTPEARWRLDLHQELRKQRKVALRLGYLDEWHAEWTLSGEPLKRLCRREVDRDGLTEHEVTYSVRQKGVDMRIGLDIASITFKKQANQIVLISGDSDFVAAAKLARREGVDFILDPMWAPIRPDLHEHIDGLRSTCPRPGTSGPVPATATNGPTGGT